MSEVCVVASAVGTSHTTPERRQELEKQRGKLFYKQNICKELGQFIFKEISEMKISPESITRLIFLGTFLKYNDNRLFITERMQMNEKDLPDVLNLSVSTVYRFVKEVSPEYLIISEDGSLSLNNDIFIFGNGISDGCSYQRIYKNAVKDLYKRTPRSKHKYLGYVFGLLPYINIEYNVLCFNPHECELENIKMMTLKEFCQKIGYHWDSVCRLIDGYSKISFDVNGRKEQFCSFVSDGKTRGSTHIFINPRIMYCGSDYGKVEVLGLFNKS